ncbi:hypothetical protein LIX60_11340 [Streptomyces sp. S07_1.15]|uniref:hypothetical protein n=1 Tax=Streptomyces sp. S07_1.15 TaxID=2873925 RepID=UPI001D13FC1E|nr:hypothetical protein [Streptomyces sp. S07_1.15]MCC3652050.1 hypothetical protein [Streptomyces sp. S07_1.15]
MLAEAFCRSDEQVRSAQATLDEAQVHRSRLLAAFAVTVGSDGAVAGVLGLNEREVRVARRTVGKEDARGVADQLLAAAAVAPEDGQAEALTAPETATAHPVGTAGIPGAAGTAGVPGAAHEVGGTVHEPYADPMAYQYYAPAQPPTQYPQSQHQQHTYYQHYQQHQTPAPQQTQHQHQHQPPPVPQQPQPQAQAHPQQQLREPRWSGAMDALLVGSWQTGVDLQVLAAEFGLDLARLISRAQQLSAEGRLSPPWAGSGPGGEPRSGRHRRSSTDIDDTYDAYDFYDSYGHPVHPGGWEVPSTVPDDMLAGVGRQSGLPQYTYSTTVP